ncbi:MAG: hypothetical protein V1728_04275, partial [Candidatus Micrarchaeota archaeon]
KYSDYVERIYRSTSITAMQLKEYDTMHNVQRAILLGPEKSFYKIYSIITKALTHIDLSKKACYPIAAETLRALQALWGNLEDWMSCNGIPMNPVLASIRTEVHSHRDEMSDSQKAALSDGVAVTDARAEFNSQTAKYGRLRAAELWCPDSRNWLKTARVGGALPELKIEVEFPLYIFLKDEPWDFLAERFEQISKEEAVAVASSIFASYHLSFREQPSYLFPVFHDEQVIFQIDLPIRLVDEAQYLVSHNALESPGFSQRERRARIEYNSFIERVAAAAREAFHKMESMTRA